MESARIGIRNRILTGSVIALLLAVAVCAPPLQTLVVRVLAQSIENLDLDVERVWIAPWGLKVSDLRLTYPGIDLGASALDVDVASWASLVHRKLDIESVSGSDIVLKLNLDELPENSPEEDATFEFEGFAPLLKMPAWLSLQQATGTLQLDVLSSQAPSLKGFLSFAIRKLQPGQQLNVDLDSTWELIRGETKLAAMHLAGDAKASVALDGGIIRAGASIKAKPLAPDRAGRYLQAAVKLDMTAEQETWSLNVDSARQSRMLQLDASYKPTAKVINIDWNAQLDPGMVNAFMQQGIPADVSGASRGQVVVDLAESNIAVESTSHMQGEGWEALDARLTRWDTLNLNMHFQLAGWDARWRAEQFNLVLASPGVGELIRVNTLQKTDWNLNDLTMVPETWGTPAVQIEIDDMPLAWLEEFDPAQVFESGFLSGAVNVVPVSRRHVRFDTTEPIRGRAMQFKDGPQGPMPPIDMEIVPLARIDNGNFEAKVERLTLRTAQGLEIAFEGHADTSLDQWPVIDFEGDLILRAPFLRKQIQNLDGFRGVAQLSIDLDRYVLAIQAMKIAAKSRSNAIIMDLHLEGEAPLELTLPDWQPDWDNFEAQQVVMQLNGLPIAWLDSYLPEVDLLGGYAYGELRAVASADHAFRLESSRPFEIRGVVPVYRGTRLSEGTEFRFTPRARLETREGEVVIDEIHAHEMGGDRLDGEVRLQWRDAEQEKIGILLDLEGSFPTVMQRFGPLGALRWQHRGYFDRTTGAVTTELLNVTLRDTNGTKVAEVTTLRPFSILGEPLHFSAPSGDGPVLRARLRPLELEQLLPRLGEFTLRGELPEGEFFGHVDTEGKLVIAARNPLLFHDVDVFWQDSQLLSRLNVSLGYEVAYSASGLEARTVNLWAGNQRGEQLFVAAMEAVAPLSDQQRLRHAQLKLGIELAALHDQPLLHELQAFERGQLEVDLNISNDEQVRVRAGMDLTNARVVGMGELPDLIFALEMDGIWGESLSVVLPTKMQSDGGSSDITFRGNVQHRDELLHFDAFLTSERFIMPDLRRFYDYLMPTEPEEGEETKADTPGAEESPQVVSRSAVRKLRQRRDIRPFWTDTLLGSAVVDINQVVFPDYALENITGELALGPSRLELSAINATMLDGWLSAYGAVDFDDSLASPYTMDFHLLLSELALGEMLRTEDGTEPVLEGMFTVKTNLSGSGRNALDLGLASLGDFKLTGHDGVFRGLAGKGNAAGTAASVTGALTFSKELKAIGRMLDDLEALPFSQMSASLVRESQEVFQLQDLELLSPRVHLEGNGYITVPAEGLLIDSPLDATVKVATRREMTTLFDGMELLDEAPDALGYRALYRPLQIGGTLSEPDTSDLWMLMDEAAENAHGFFGLGMRAVNRKIKKQQATQEQ